VLKDVIRTLHSLYNVRARADVPIAEFARDVVDAMTASGDADLMLSKTESEGFFPKLETLLSVEPLNYLAKANSLQRDHEHLFHDAKILTDLRPVFHAPDQQPKDMIVEYTLKVVFHDGSKHREIYMVLDESDLVRLRSTID